MFFIQILLVSQTVKTLLPHHILQCLALQHYTGYRPSELKECILAIHDLQLNRKGSSLRAIRNKYKENKVPCVHISLVILLQTCDVYMKRIN